MQQFYSELLPDIWTLHSIFDVEPSRPVKKTPSGNLYLCSHLFSHYPKLRWGLESRLSSKSGSAHSSSQQSGIAPTLLLMWHQSACRPRSPFYPLSWTRRPDTWTPFLGSLTPPFSARLLWPQSWRCWLSSLLRHTSLQNLPSLMKTFEPCICKMQWVC